MLRHAVATLAYRSGKALRDAPEGFGDFQAGSGARTPVEILAHMGDLLEWALSIADGKPNWGPAAPQSWDKECKRYFSALAAFDARLASHEPIQRTPERLLQAPVADALTHTGQLTLMRRMAGSPVRGENYYVAPIAAGKVGPDQDPPRSEF
ncbi:MAG: hypothetical protein R2748_30740 [Bryobacterales bacterium]